MVATKTKAEISGFQGSQSGIQRHTHTRPGCQVSANVGGRASPTRPSGAPVPSRQSSQPQRGVLLLRTTLETSHCFEARPEAAP